jgi:integrase
MAAIRERRWTTKTGKKQSAWIVRYSDQNGNERQKTFTRRKDANAFALRAESEVSRGEHVADTDSKTVAEAGALWIASATDAQLEESTLAQYCEHLTLHIVPFIGSLKLNRLSVPVIRAFADQLRAEGRSSTMVRYVLRSLGSILSDAQERGLIIRNPVREMRARRRRKADRQDKRGKRLKAGTDIPTPEEMGAILKAVNAARDLAFLYTAAFTGLRASELRGLPWVNVDLKKSELRVTQRADRLNRIGAPKSEAAERTIPLPVPVVTALRAWKLAVPKGPLGLVFPNAQGHVAWRKNLVEDLFWPAQIAGGVTVQLFDKEGRVRRDESGRPIVGPKYKGLHAVRHFFASWCINRKADGGLELPPKLVQERMGHSSITLTYDVYGHLFPTRDDNTALDAAAVLLLK